MEHRSIGNTLQGHAELVTWAQSAGVQRVGIEGSGNYGNPAPSRPAADESPATGSTAAATATSNKALHTVAIAQIRGPDG